MLGIIAVELQVAAVDLPDAAGGEERIERVAGHIAVLAQGGHGLVPRHPFHPGVALDDFAQAFIDADGDIHLVAAAVERVIGAVELTANGRPQGADIAQPHGDAIAQMLLNNRARPLQYRLHLGTARRQAAVGDDPGQIVDILHPHPRRLGDVTVLAVIQRRGVQEVLQHG